MYLTKHDINYMLNYYDIRSSEFDLNVNGGKVPWHIFCESLTTYEEIVSDKISASLIKKNIASAKSYYMTIRKNFPFHTALCKDVLDLSLKNMSYYSPTLFVAKQATIDLKEHCPHFRYIRVFEGRLNDITNYELTYINNEKIIVSKFAIFAIYSFNPDIHNQILTKLFRQRLNTINVQYKTYSNFSRKTFGNKIKSLGTLLSNISSKSYISTIMKIIPSSAKQRLTSYIYLKENNTIVKGELIPWMCQYRNGQLTRYDETQYEISKEISFKIKNIKNANFKPVIFDKNEELDKLVLSGMFGYTHNNRFDRSGLPILVSELDPKISVRINHDRLWMTHGNEGCEGIIRLPDYKNVAIGTCFMSRKLQNSLYNRRLLFCGLGLGSLPRVLSRKTNEITVVEISSAVIDLFKKIFTEVNDTLEIIEDNFFSFIKKSNRKWDTIIIDIYDPKLKSINKINFKAILRNLDDKGDIIISYKFIAFDARRFEVQAKEHKLKLSIYSIHSNQKIIKFSRR